MASTKTFQTASEPMILFDEDKCIEDYNVYEDFTPSSSMIVLLQKQKLLLTLSLLFLFLEYHEYCQSEELYLAGSIKTDST